MPKTTPPLQDMAEADAMAQFLWSQFSIQAIDLELGMDGFTSTLWDDLPWRFQHALIETCLRLIVQQETPQGLPSVESTSQTERD